MQLVRLIVLFCLGVLILPTWAQEESTPEPTPVEAAAEFFDLLAYVPDTELVRNGFLTYLDFKAVLEARGEAEAFEDVDAWQSLGADTSFARRWITHPDDVSEEWLSQATRVPEIMGFDLFDLERVVGFGRLPETGVVWRGAFALHAMRPVLVERGYIDTDVNGVWALCGGDGCSMQPAIDFNNPERANLFDPALGRNLPVLIADEFTLVTVKEVVFLPQAAQTLSTGQGNLQANPTIMTMLEALNTVNGQLVQAEILPSDTSAILRDFDLDDPLALRDLPQAMQGGGDDDTPLPDWATLYQWLPPFQRMALADYQDGLEQVAVIALLYEIEGNAGLGAIELSNRLSIFNDAGRRPTETPLIESHGGTVTHSTYVSEATGLTVALIEVRYPNSADLTNPAAIYRAFHETLMAGLFYPLWNIET